MLTTGSVFDLLMGNGRDAMMSQRRTAMKSLQYNDEIPLVPIPARAIPALVPGLEGQAWGHFRTWRKHLKSWIKFPAEDPNAGTKFLNRI